MYRPLHLNRPISMQATPYQFFCSHPPLYSFITSASVENKSKYDSPQCMREDNGEYVCARSLLSVAHTHKHTQTQTHKHSPNVIPQKAAFCKTTYRDAAEFSQHDTSKAVVRTNRLCQIPIQSQLSCAMYMDTWAGEVGEKEAAAQIPKLARLARPVLP